MLTTCPFCPKNRDSLTDRVVWETKYSVAMYARRPLTAGHCIIFPTKHVSNPETLSSSDRDQFFKDVTKLIKALKLSYETTSYNVFANVGTEAGQSVPHLHFHVILRFTNEKRSPFTVLNNRKLYKALPTITPAKLRREIQKISSKMTR